MDQNLQYSKKRLFVGNLPRDVSNYDGKLFLFVLMLLDRIEPAFPDKRSRNLLTVSYFSGLDIQSDIGGY